MLKLHRQVYVSIRLYCSAHALRVVQLDLEIGNPIVEGKSCQIQLHQDLLKLPNELRVYKTRRVEKENEEGIGISEINERRKKYSWMLHICASNRSLNEGKAVHGHVIKNGIDPDLHLWNSVVNIYAKCGSYRYARRVLDKMPDRDVVSWTALIAGFVEKGLVGEGMDTFCEMRKQGVRPNDCTLTTCLKVCSMCLDLDLGKQLHAEIIKAGVSSDVFVRSSLINLYAKCNQMELADKLFVCMPEKNVVLWNSILNGWAQMYFIIF